MNEYKIIKVNGREHVLRSLDRGDQQHFLKGKDNNKVSVEPIPEPNYLGTSMALCGVLLPGESLEGWIKRTKKDKYGNF
jgi:hypothetical protein